MPKPAKVLLFALLLPLIGRATSADTLTVTIRQADSIFLVNNYDLLAAALNIDAQKALVLQSKLYPNPVVTADFNAWAAQSGKPFNVGPQGQKAFQIEQLILIGGKRKAEIELAKSDAKVAELQFQELIRQLKFKLHTGLHAINQQLTLLKNYNSQLKLLDTLLSSYEVQVGKGNLPLKDLVRLKGVYLNLNNDRAELMKTYLESMTAVQTILQISREVRPVITEAELQSSIKIESLDVLKDLTLANRPDYLISQEYQNASAVNLRLQKRQMIPDVNLIGSYDQRGGAFINQYNVGISIPLPVWNRNQGNIKAASIRAQQASYNEEGLKAQLFSELQNNYTLYNHTVAEYNKSNQLYNADFELTLRGISDNFIKRNITVIEFTDFFEAYNLAVAEIARIKIQLATSAEMLNLTIGKEIF